MQVGNDWAGDYSRFTFDEADQYLMVLKEQGKEILDDEMNLQGEIPLMLLRRLIVDAFGNACPGDSFKIVGTGANNNFTITGGDGTLKGAAHAYVSGLMAILESNVAYADQSITQSALTTPGGARTDKVYLDAWLDEWGPSEDAGITDPVLNKVTSRRLKLLWAVKVAEGGAMPADYTDANGLPHFTMLLATINRTAQAAIDAEMVVDERTGMISEDADPPPTDWDGSVRALVADGNNVVFTLHGAATTKIANVAWAAGSAEGLLVDAAQANTTYAVYAIANDTSGAIDYIGSTGLASPTSVPVGWSVIRRVSVITLDGSSALRPFVQSGRRVQYIRPWLVMSNTSAALSRWEGTHVFNLHTATVAGCLPNSIAQLHVRSKSPDLTDEHYVHVAHPDATISLSAECVIAVDLQKGDASGANNVFELRGRADVPVDGSCQVRYTTGTEATGTATIEFIILGVWI